MKCIPDFPKVAPNNTTWKFFRRYSAYTFVTCGFIFATWVTDSSNLADDWYTRPDFKQKAAMVKEPTHIDDAAYQQMLQHNYSKYKIQHQNKSSSLYRLFFARDADWSNDKKSLYQNRDPSQNYNTNRGEFPTLTHDYSEHLH